MTDVVERFVRHAAGHAAVADHSDDVTELVDARVARDREAIGIRQHCRCVAVLDVVVGTFLAVGVTREPAGLAQLIEPRLTTSDDLVHVCLVAGVPQNCVGGRVEYAVQRQRQLDGTEVAAEVPSVLGDGLHDEVADFSGQIGKLRMTQFA